MEQENWQVGKRHDKEPEEDWDDSYEVEGYGNTECSRPPSDEQLED